MTVPALITYPARPIQGGRLELAPPKRGLWYAEPKLNGWRALIHTPTGTMWNRHGAMLTIADCFRPALAALAKLAEITDFTLYVSTTFDSLLDNISIQTIPATIGDPAEVAITEFLADPALTAPRSV